MKRLAIIPARGGSKRIPNKNIRDFCGKPMISYALGAARSSELFDTIHVSTDSLKISNVVDNLGFPIDFMRPKSLADDYTRIMPVLKYVTDEYAKINQAFDQVWMLMACAPLIDAIDLIKAEKLFSQAGGRDPLLAVSEYPVPIEWAFSRKPNGRMIPLQPGMFAKRSQDLEKSYYDAGSFAAFPAKTVECSQGAGTDDAFIGYVLPKGTSIDIDDEQDWALAESIFQMKAGKLKG